MITLDLPKNDLLIMKCTGCLIKNLNLNTSSFLKIGFSYQKTPEIMNILP